MNGTDKSKPYFFVDDYGQGGIWVVVVAESPEQVVAVYPGLSHVQHKPEWAKNGLKFKEYRLDEMPEEYDYLKAVKE
ncbi:MAG: hypothetical protein AB2588_16825 [Candidatus Thiodiazotropha sp.]